MEPELREYVYYVQQLFELKAVIRHGVCGTCGVKNSVRTVEALDEFYPTTKTQRTPIIIQERNRMNFRVENSEKIVGSLPIQERFRDVQQETRTLKGQFFV